MIYEPFISQVTHRVPNYGDAENVAAWLHTPFSSFALSRHNRALLSSCRWATMAENATWPYMKSGGDDSHTTRPDQNYNLNAGQPASSSSQSKRPAAFSEEIGNDKTPTELKKG